MPLPVVQATGVNLHLESGGTPLHILKDIDLTLNAGEVAAVEPPPAPAEPAAGPAAVWMSSDGSVSASTKATSTSSPSLVTMVTGDSSFADA